MAETITRQLREPFVESAGLGITDRGLQLLKTPIPTATYTGRQFVQGQSALEQQATRLAGQTGVGAGTTAQGIAQLQAAEDVETATKVFEQKFERPAKGSTDKRIRAAREILAKMETVSV